MEEKRQRKIDPRFYQIFSLSILLILGLLILGFDTNLQRVLLTISSCLIAQVICDRFFLKSFKSNWSSALITSFSLSLLLRTNHWWLVVLACGLSIFSKVIFSYKGKHLFNPANFGIVLALFTGLAWVSPGQWGNSILLALLFIILGGATMWRSLRMDVGLFFLFMWCSLVIGRALFVGDPLTIPFHRLSSGSLLLFSFFMITDPRSTPSHPVARYIFAAVVAFVGWWGQTFYFKPDFLFYALFFVSITTRLWDWIFPANTYSWSNPSLGLQKI